jgi:m7GpppX diphosphatase
MMTDNCEREKPSKILKLEASGDGVVSKISPSFKSFEGFKVKRILKEIPESRSVVVEGSFSEDDSGDSISSVVVLEKTHFTENEVQGILTKNTALQCLFNNDVYYNFMCHPPIQLNGVKATLIHPASEKHIEKFSTRKSFLIEETPLVYQYVTLLHIRDTKFDLQVS